MKVLVVGAGGREHAIIRKLKENKTIEQLYACPGNGGIEADARCVNLDAKDIEGIVSFAVKENIDYVVVAPDDPLVLGLVDALEAAGISCFGPSRAAAAIEGSKIFAKQLMEKYHIPTAAYRSFSDPSEAIAYACAGKFPVVIKADGLALGKGVVIAGTAREAEEAIREMMVGRKFGESGSRVVVEEFLTGPEVSVLCFTDGHAIVPMVSSMDHKRALDGDQGLNTGGMGTIAPNPYYTDETAEICMETIFLPTIRAMALEGRPFKGCLYFGLMLTTAGPKVIEYNCRFGDPETQVVLPLLESDLFEIMQAVTKERLSDISVRFSGRHACCVIMASEGYPQAYQKGKEIEIPEELLPHVYVAGASRRDGKLLSSGGRVLGVTAVGDTLAQAIDEAYRRTEQIHFSNACYRKDIGQRALAAEGRRR